MQGTIGNGPAADDSQFSLCTVMPIGGRVSVNKVYGIGMESVIWAFETLNQNWGGYQPSGIEYWKVVHQIIQLNPLEERDIAMMQGLKNLGIEKGKPFDPSAAQKKRFSSASPGRLEKAS